LVGCAGAAVAGAAATAEGCVSSNNPGAPGTDSGSTASDTGAPTPDASFDATVTDAGVDSASEDAGIDTGVDAGVDAGCTPRALPAGYASPPYIHWVGQQTLDCYTNGNSLPPSPVLQTLGADCFGDASTYASCNSYAATGEDGGAVSTQCATCLFSPEGSDAGYGPMIQSVVLVPNLAGCIEGADKSDAGLACAEAVQAAWECGEAACKAACPVSDDTSRDAYLACATAAAASVCATYAQAATTCLAAERIYAADAGPQALGNSDLANYCFGGATTSDEAADIAAYFCAS
jgi:hypothetical protein